MFNLAIDSKLRGCDLVSLKVEDVALRGFAPERATVRQRKTGHPVKFELTEQTRETIDAYMRRFGRKRGDFLFASRCGGSRCISTRQYARLLANWTTSAGLDPRNFDTHSLRRTKATLIYRRTGNLKAVQLLLGHTKIESTVRYLGVEVDDALAIAERGRLKCLGRADMLCPTFLSPSVAISGRSAAHGTVRLVILFYCAVRRWRSRPCL